MTVPTQMRDHAVDPEEIVRELFHRTCIGAVAQPETGGALLLHFADWQPYEEPLNKALLSSERGKWSLMVHSPWRLDGPSAIVCDWRSVADVEKAIDEAHLSFEGLRVEVIDLIKPGNDLRIVFSRGFALKVLCDSEGVTEDCWYLLRPDDSTVAATHGFRLIYEPPSHNSESGRI
jgi:hypothetical protein